MCRSLWLITIILRNDTLFPLLYGSLLPSPFKLLRRDVVDVARGLALSPRLDSAEARDAPADLDAMRECVLSEIVIKSVGGVRRFPIGLDARKGSACRACAMRPIAVSKGIDDDALHSAVEQALAEVLR